MKQSYTKKPSEQRRIALERIQTLFREADQAFKQDPKLSNRYVQLARKISMKYKVRLPSELKKRFCKHCYSYLKQGKNCIVRLHNSKLVYTCQNCKKVMRFPYLREQMLKRKIVRK